MPSDSSQTALRTSSRNAGDGPLRPRARFGDFQAGNNTLAHAVFGFFNNGGTACYVTRVNDATDVGQVQTALRRFESIDEIAIVAVPGALDAGVRNRGLARPNDVNMPDLDPNVRRRNWIVLIVLVAVAAAMYVSFMIKMMSHS